MFQMIEIPSLQLLQIFLKRSFFLKLLLHTLCINFEISVKSDVSVSVRSCCENKKRNRESSEAGMHLYIVKADINIMASNAAVYYPDFTNVFLNLTQI